MASIPEREEVFVQDQDQVDLGWTYDKDRKKFLPCESPINEFKTCSPKFYCEIRKNDSIHHLVENSLVFSGTAWVDDYKQIKTENVILLKGSKIIEKKSNIPAHHQEFIVSSLNFKYHVDMLINSPYELGDNLLADLKKYFYSMVDGNTVSYIPNGLYMDYFNAVIYLPGNRKSFNSIKHALQEFCRLVKDSEMSKHPFSTYLIKPVPLTCMSSTYASVLKDSKTETKEINLTFAPKTHKNQIHTNLTTETKNQGIRNENISKCGGNHVDDKKENKMQENRNSWPRNEAKVTYIKNAQICNGSKSFSEKGKKISSTGKPEELAKNRKLIKDRQLAEVHVCHQYANSLPKDTVSKSEMAVGNERNCVTPIGSDREGDKSSKGHTGFDYALRSKGRVSKDTSAVQMLNKCSKIYTPKDHKVESKVVKSDGSKLPSLYNTKASEHQVQFDQVSLTSTLERGKDLGGDVGINFDKIVAKVYETESGSFNLQENVNLNEASKSSDYPISLLTKDFQNSQPRSDCSSSCSIGEAHNSDLQINSKLSLKEICNSGSGNAKANISDNSNISQDKFQGHFKHSTNEDKEDFSATLGYLKPQEEVFDECGMIRKYYGVHSQMKQKTIIILGASGSGKTTLVNFVANYYKGVKSADGELVHVVKNSNDVRSYTTSITAYTFCSGEQDTPITIIDTPGLNDSSGAEVRDHVQSLKTFLANAASHNFEIHAIGFVAQAHLVRLTSSERLVMDYVSTLFGQDIENHFFTFVTFADNQETPPVVEAMTNYGVKCNSFLKFNNSALSNSKTNEIDDLDRVYWRIGNKSWKKFMKSLHNLPALSVNTLKTLQNEVFASTVVESAERELRAELKVFVSYCKGDKYITKEGLHLSDKVWELASIVHHLRSNQVSNSMNVECILVSFVEEVCKELGTHHNTCIKNLSLAPSRSLLNAGIGVIQSIEPLFKNAVESLNKQRKTCLKIIPKFLYCHNCDENHDLERIQPSSKRRVPIFGSNTMVITYRCVKCKCDGNGHGENPEDDSSECSPTQSLDLHKLLEHTRNCLTGEVEKFSTLGSFINVDYYLKYINNVTNHEFDNFIQDLLQMTLK